MHADFLSFFQKMIVFFSTNIIETVTIFISIIGGTVALLQWKKGNDYKRAQLVQELINKVRDDLDVSLIMDVIDWNDGIKYDGKFRFLYNERDERYNNLSSDELFSKIDKTLSHFSYICYLYKRNLFAYKDMVVFEYELRRIIDNAHICNYLYSLYHWSKYLQVRCSFDYLIEYAKKKNYLDKDFFVLQKNTRYECYLGVPTGDCQ